VHVVGACLQSIPRSDSSGVPATFLKNFAICQPLLVRTVWRIGKGCIAHINAAISDAGIMSAGRDLPTFRAWWLSSCGPFLAMSPE
jgi:hypothetical protein